MPFKQTFNAPIGNVYNVDGNAIILTAQSGAQDFLKELAKLRAELAEVPELAPPVRERIETDLAAAQSEGSARQPNGVTLKQHLDRAAGTLEGITGVASRGEKLAKTLYDIGKWAVALWG